MTPDRTSTYWRWFSIMAALEAGAAFVLLARVPSEGLSASRLVLFGVLLLSLVFFVFLSLRPPRGLDALARPRWILAAAGCALTIGLSLFLLRYLDPARLLPVYARLGILLWYLFALSTQLAVLLLLIRKGTHSDQLIGSRPVIRTSLFVFAFLLVVFCFVGVTRLGLTPDPAYWGEPGVAIMGWQFAVTLLASAFVFCILLFSPSSRLRGALPLVVWLLAVGLWLSVPMDVLKNSFYVQIDPPAHVPFPYSDAGYYDSMAHSLLIGYPYQGEVPTRPLYIVFLALLHLLFGENYPLIIAAQTTVLALIPVTLYLLGARLHSPAAGLTAALLAIFRELTALWVSSETRVSNTRTLLVDLPTLLFLLTACLFALRWLERRDAKSAFLAGGTFGLFVLLRTQSFLVLPLLFALAAFAYELRWRRWLPAALLFVVGTAITVTPWLLHNYRELGTFTFDAPFQYKVIASQYAYTGNLDIQAYDFEGKSLARVFIDFTLKDPAFVFGFIANHFLAGQVDGLLALPLIETYNGIFEPLNLYWLRWTGQLAWYNVLLVIGYLAVMAIGIAASWRRLRWVGLLPLAFNIGYSLATAIGRFSGWRYDLPADWVPYFYFGIGFVEILRWIALFFGADLQASSAEPQAHDSGPPGLDHARIRWDGATVLSLSILALSFALIGSLPWLAEFPAKPRYLNRIALESRLAQLPGAPDETQLDAFLAEPGSALVEGRLLYPRYFYRGVGIASANAWPAYAVREYPRTGFVLLNESLQDVLFPAQEAQPFPHAADAMVLGCQKDGYLEARLVAFPESGSIYQAEGLWDPCA